MHTPYNKNQKKFCQKSMLFKQSKTKDIHTGSYKQASLCLPVYIYERRPDIISESGEGVHWNRVCVLPETAGAARRTRGGAGAGAATHSGTPESHAPDPIMNPPRASYASYSRPSQFASKNFLNHCKNSKLSWNLPFISLSTGITQNMQYLSYYIDMNT